jgi:predicted dehydrogenase/threonine dehydrogenase-like Zn-dependent dehydrogenase
MKQLLQNMRDGQTKVVDVPIPFIKKKTALVETSCSLVSAGTERMLVEFAEKSLANKATSRPDLVKQVLTKAKREGILPTIEATFNKLDQPLALGYSSAGTIIEIGEGLTGFKIGDRVACAGGNFAVHAEYNLIPQNLLTKLPDSVDFESAAFTTLGAVAMQGFRLAHPQLGERVCVIGLGLLGLLTVGIAKTAGCVVLGIDISKQRVDLARSMGADAMIRPNCEESAMAFSQGFGFDHVLICADTSGNDPIELAGLLARNRGTVISVGVVGLNIPRKVYYEKELDFKVSCSYGPGRYDPDYEEKGVDYPYGFVRWTEGRNMQAFVELLASGKLDIHPLITHRFAVDNAEKAYQLITGKTKEDFLGVLLTYPEKVTGEKPHKKVEFISKTTTTSSIKVGALGAGIYAMATFLPAVKKSSNADLIGIASGAGLTATTAAKRFGFRYAASSEVEVLSDPDINTVIIMTRHQQHARQVVTALRAGKNVYCEKPLALTEEELSEIENTLRQENSPFLTVGYNRRFAPFAIEMKRFFGTNPASLHVHYRINAGFLPSTHWQHDPIQGGGRIIGEGCHFIDFLSFMTGEIPASVYASALPDNGQYHQDNVSMVFRYKNGSLGVVDYLANGNKNFGKERIEVFGNGKIAVLDDFRILELVSESKRTAKRSGLRQNKGHQAAWEAFCESITKGSLPTIPYDQLMGVNRACFAVMRSLQTNQEIEL